MKQLFGKILVAVDGSHSCLRAKEVTASLAQKFGSKVTVVHVISHDFMHPELKSHHQLPSLVLHELDKSFQRSGRKIVKAAEEFFKEENVEVESELVRGEDPAERILQINKKSEFDLLVVGSNSGARAEGFSLGSVAEKIALYAECPVLIAKRKTKLKKFLVPVDGSEKSDKALEYAVQLCRRFKASVTLLHVERGDLFRLEPKFTRQLGEEILAEATSKAKGVTYDTLLEFGNPAETILRVAKHEDYDLVILGSRGVSSIKRFLLGSVSAEVSMHAKRSVLLVR
jgi:nucleotide-binding universal stress UspA family protein